MNELFLITFLMKLLCILVKNAVFIHKCYVNAIQDDITSKMFRSGCITLYVKVVSPLNECCIFSEIYLSLSLSVYKCFHRNGYFSRIRSGWPKYHWGNGYRDDQKHLDRIYEKQICLYFLQEHLIFFSSKMYSSARPVFQGEHELDSFIFFFFLFFSFFSSKYYKMVEIVESQALVQTIAFSFFIVQQVPQEHRKKMVRQRVMSDQGPECGGGRLDFFMQYLYVC